MRRFGVFEGVFVPTLLSILGVILFLRLGWVVGQVGLWPSLLIILLSNSITFLTALSLTSIVSNRRIGGGGAYSIISKSLGLEAGGAIGISLYLSQAVSIAFYITGFSELWVNIFSGQNQMIVSIVVWAVLFFISQRSAKIAFRLQYGILLLIALALFSIFMAFKGFSMIGFSGAVNDVPFWRVFAVFFPAVTGILAGVNMSGELRNPERAIPLGTLSAIVLSFVIYSLMAIWFSSIAPAHILVENSGIAVERARWPILVVLGIMGATLSSALSMFVSSPRVLLALAKHRIVPFSSFLSRVNDRDEPVPAVMITSLISLVALLAGSLNSLAVFLTMIFLITYGMINFSVFVEQSIGIVSFRPSFRLPLIVPLLGVVAALLSMFLIDPLFSILALFSLFLVYLHMLRRDFPGSWPDVRKGVLMFLAENSLRIAEQLPYHPKLWKPNLIVPVFATDSIDKWRKFMEGLLYPNGRVLLVCRASQGELADSGDRFARELRRSGLFAISIALDEGSVAIIRQAIYLSRQYLLPSNILFLELIDGLSPEFIQGALRIAKEENMGVILYKSNFPLDGLSAINLWIREGSPNVHLAILLGLHLYRGLDTKINLIQVVKDRTEVKKGRIYLEKMKDVMRLPSDTGVYVLLGEFMDVLSSAPVSDINVFGMPQAELDLDWLDEVSRRLNTPMAFLKDSRQESARA